MGGDTPCSTGAVDIGMAMDSVVVGLSVYGVLALVGVAEGFGSTNDGVEELSGHGTALGGGEQTTNVIVCRLD